MEVGLDAKIPTYSGGLGILAGDTIKSFADQHVPAVAVTLLNEKGYFNQILEEGRQREVDCDFKKENLLMPLDTEVSITLQGREVKIRAWEYRVVGCDGFEVPLYFLDTNVEGNDPFDRGLTSHLYGGDSF